MMFSAFCPTHDTRVLMTRRNVLGFWNGPDGPVILWKCNCGHDGFVEKATRVRDVTRRFVEAVEAIDGLVLTHPPDMSLFQFTSTSGDIGAIGDVMDDRGWHLDRQQGGLHLMLWPFHEHVVEQFATDLADAVVEQGESRGKAASYGGIS